MVSGYDKNSPEPRYRPAATLGWHFWAGALTALVTVLLVYWVLGA